MQGDNVMIRGKDVIEKRIVINIHDANGKRPVFTNNVFLSCGTMAFNFQKAAGSGPRVLNHQDHAGDTDP